MAKKGPIGKVEAFYIDQHYQNMPIAELAEDLDRTITSIERYIKKKNSRKENTQTTITVGDQMSRREGVTIMTENASSLADTKRQYRKKSRPSCITKIK